MDGEKLVDGELAEAQPQISGIQKQNRKLKTELRKYESLQTSTQAPGRDLEIVYGKLTYTES